MSHSRNLIFTDAIKDVIGNEPVLDQFDIDYAASYYGGMQDDYVTGSMVRLSKVEGTNVIKFTSGSRGLAFSKTYAGTTSVSVDNVLGSDYSKFPRLSRRYVPLEDVTSKSSFRLSQCFDSSERYYDTCLPDLKTCFDADGASIWTVSGENASAGFLSPLNLAITSSVGYLFFNAQLNNGLVMTNNARLTNNTWTYSYPYENKYNPKKRFVKLNDSEVFGAGLSSYSTAWKYASNIEPFKFARRLSKPQKVSSFFPILPGFLDPNDLAPGGRNAVKIPYVDFDTNKVEYPISNDSTLESAGRGTSWLIPADVFLNTTVNNEYITGTLSNEDMTKFLFGFGDLNNITHTKLKFIDPGSGSAYTQGFGGPVCVPGSHVTGSGGPGLTTFTAAGVTVDWTEKLRNNKHPDMSGDLYVKPWIVGVMEGTHIDYKFPYTGDESKPHTYNYIISGTYSGPGQLSSSYVGKAGIYWYSPGTTRTQLLMSDSSLFNGTQLDKSNYLGDSPYYSESAAVVVVTSSSDWAFSYDRAVSCDRSDGLFVWLAEFPDNVYPTGKVVPIEFLTGSAQASTDSVASYKRPGKSIGIMSNFHLLDPETHTGIKLSESIRKNYELSSLNYDGLTSWPECETRLHPLPPGTYKLVFSYLKSGSSATPLSNEGDTTSYVDRAAIDNFKVFTYDKQVFVQDEDSPTMGGNNYPEFRKTFVDSRMTRPEYYFGSPTELTGTISSNSSYNFGVSPVIRGWKYGLHNGFPTYTKAVFRQGRYGQLRDMLEQRQYGKFLNVTTSNPYKNSAINSIDDEEVEALPQALGPAAVSVNFVKRQYIRNEKGIGRIYNSAVDPIKTTSQNLSTEVTSSVPYEDGVSRHRSEESYNEFLEISSQWSGITRSLARDF